MRTKETETKSKSADESKFQVDDPIIIKGGSVSVRFDQHNFREHTVPAEQNRRFGHGHNPQLRYLRIFRAGAIFYETPLNPTDTIQVCYTGSYCEAVEPQ
jgi:hypothetical protein